ncbi:SOS response UmuD protein [Leptolyngbya sp. PCC 7375]|nr:SOS response UmuD protein [Leptolyngbya sp. PCC 7375]
MPSGGYRENSGKKLKWGEKLMKVGVPRSLGNALVAALHDVWVPGEDGQDIIDALYNCRENRVNHYDYPVSAGASAPSELGGTSPSSGGIAHNQINLHEALIDNPEKTFIVSVIGDSMTGIGIHPGDWLIVEEIDSSLQPPQNGDIVIVSVNDEVMVKCYHQEDEVITLKSENEDHEPIVISESSEAAVYVSGIVRSAIRRNL